MQEELVPATQHSNRASDKTHRLPRDRSLWKIRNEECSVREVMGTNLVMTRAREAAVEDSAVEEEASGAAALEAIVDVAVDDIRVLQMARCREVTVQDLAARFVSKASHSTQLRNKSND